MLKSERPPKKLVYKDGVLMIYSVKNVAPPGDPPEEAYTLKVLTHFADKVIGYQRRIAAMQVESSCDRVIEIEDPLDPEIIQGDAAQVIDNTGRSGYYVIDMIDHLVDVKPAALRLQLRRRDKW